MTFWNKLFKKNTPPLPVFEEKELPEKFRQMVFDAIHLMGSDSKEMGNEELFKYLVQNRIPEYEANELVLFIPIAFVRKMLPQVKWHDSYCEVYEDQRMLSKKYRYNKRYKVIEEERNKLWSQINDNQFVLNIVGRSPEFHAINKLLNEDKGYKLDDIELSETCIKR